MIKWTLILVVPILSFTGLFLFITCKPQASETKYVALYEDELPTQKSICGIRKQFITRDMFENVSFSVLHITDATPHYHKKTTEFYYVVEGQGTLEVDGEKIPLRLGAFVMIKPTAVHKSYGDFRAIVAGSPAFSHEDTFIVEEVNRSQG